MSVDRQTNRRDVLIATLRCKVCGTEPERMKRQEEQAASKSERASVLKLYSDPTHMMPYT